MPLDDNMKGFQCKQCLNIIDFKDAEIHKETNAYFQWKKEIKKVLKT